MATEKEDDHDKVIRLEERLAASAEALKVAADNTHSIRAELLAILAIIVSVYALFRK